MTIAPPLHSLSDRAFVRETFDRIDAANQSAIWSAADTRAKECYEEAELSGRLHLYQRAFDAAYAKAQADRQYARMFDLLAL